MTSKLQRCSNVAFINRSEDYPTTAGQGPCHPYPNILVMSIIEDSTVTVKCGKQTKALFLYFNLCLTVKQSLIFILHPSLRHLKLLNGLLIVLFMDHKRDPNSESSHILRYTEQEYQFLLVIFTLTTEILQYCFTLTYFRQACMSC